MLEQDTQPQAHPQFEQMCARLGDWEPLPTVVAKPASPPPADDDERNAPIDELILAGLVSP
jgi:hypothetical protein